MKRPGRLLCESWEAAAMLEGTMCQKRVPGPAHFWKVGQLRWVQEPFIEFIGRREPTKYGVVYRADHKDEMAGAPPHLKHVDCKVKVRSAEEMRMMSSRLTIEVTEVVRGERTSFFSTDDYQAEGLSVARAWGLDTLQVEVFRRGVPKPDEVIIIRFTVIKANVSHVLAERRAA